jgi:hypothetical protein
VPWSWLLTKWSRVVSGIVGGWKVVSTCGGGGLTSWHNIRERTM